MDVEISPEFLFKPYQHQCRAFEALNDGIKRIILVWPRRAGKDLTLLNLMVIQSQLRVGTYFYFFPTHKQAKRVIWDGMDDDGNKFLSYIPDGLIAENGLNESELQITMVNSSIIQLLGADTIDTSALGTNCIGVVFSEYPVQQASGWDYVRPILAKNGGWAAFAYTPRGHNHGYELYIKNKDNPDWYVSKLEAPDIIGHLGERLITDEMIDYERRSGMLEETVQQEFYTSFSGLQAGSFFSDQLIAAETVEPKRLGIFPYMPDEPVYTVSDLGVGLRFFTWFFQVHRGMVRWIDCNQLDSGAIPEFIKMVRAKPYIYAEHFAPFDIGTIDQSTGYTRIMAATKLGLHFHALPKLLISDRIDLARRVFPISLFNEITTRPGWKALLGYRRKYNEDLREFSVEEVHDENSHGGTAFCYGCVAVRRFLGVTTSGAQAVTDFDEFHNETPKQSYETDFNEFSNYGVDDEEF
jgi:hypothetical protein